MKRPGRPRREPQQRLVALSLSLPAPQYDELYRRASFYGETMSAVTRRVIVAGLRQTAPPKHGG